MSQGVVNKIFWNLEYIFVPIHILGRRRTGWLPVGRDENVTLSIKSWRKFFHIQNDVSRGDNSPGTSLGKNDPLVFLWIDNLCNQLKKQSFTFSVNWHRCLISWDKAFSRDYKRKKLESSTFICFIESGSRGFFFTESQDYILVRSGWYTCWVSYSVYSAL